MKKYSLQEISSVVEKSPNVIENWMNELEFRLNHQALIENGEKYFDDLDLRIIKFIMNKRDERLSFNEIFTNVDEVFELRQNEEIDVMGSKEINKSQDNNIDDYATFSGLGRDPESLFYDIAQDNEIIKMFKYHSLRVMFLSGMLAKRVNCYDEDLRVAALLHDIGKMGLSSNILLKPEKLSDLEFSIIQSHCHIGNVIVRKHLGLTRAAKFIRDHHERWDGKGYPRRLVGDEITIQGRIISICDAFDTMTIDQRNYKKNTLSYDDAFEELHKCSWRQFDGNLVKVFTDMREDIVIPDYMIQEI
ncbi:HD domain-containing phosphohydrolase [Pontibacillus marinus]|uniref:Uncharacterized protein n=1 Tax=Pontibacillus marinus BH030004 = DSM 16465 TaxID=1385511 RepID=A0A0A5G5C9_9BACI|nr:HD domain-containing phosphohydrolase [Pontibacillus marinus]KGX88336.1 hypothetical protein N783_08615 [Pontibacillus marinus BH030004 = DSM 16465]